MYSYLITVLTHKYIFTKFESSKNHSYDNYEQDRDSAPQIKYPQQKICFKEHQTVINNGQGKFKK